MVVVFHQSRQQQTGTRRRRGLKPHFRLAETVLALAELPSAVSGDIQAYLGRQSRGDPLLCTALPAQAAR